MLSTRARDPRPALPLRAAAISLAAFAVVLVGRGPLAGLVPRTSALEHSVAVLVVQYAVIAAVVVVVARRWGTGTLVDTVGLRVGPADLRAGVLTWLWGLTVVAAVAAAVHHLGLSSTAVPVPRIGAGTAGAPLGLLAVTGVVMVVAAPLFEEVVFRGILLRALDEVLPTTMALALQGAVFAAFHLRPGRGTADAGLVLSLAGLGVLLGRVAHRHGRLGPAIIAHSLHNIVAFALLLATGR